MSESATRVRRGFTLVELMIAMTITLLLMAALARSFATIGQSIKEGRSQVALSSKLAGASFRIRHDLGLRTVEVAPPVKSEAGKGYFMYYEGPLTEQTFAMFGARPERRLEDGTVVYQFNPPDDPAGTADADFQLVDSSPTYRRHSRIGDFDDYIAFTAEAAGDEWFTGKVPRYLVDDSVDVNTNGVIDAAESHDAMTPVVIRSKFAEIIIWASPVWSVDSATNTLNVAPHPSGMPLYKDDDLDLVPDGIVLHQRVLLIRPDLNRNRIIPGGVPFNADVLRPALDNTNPYAVPPALHAVYPIGTPNPGAGGSPPPPVYPNYAVAGSATNNSLMLQSNWLVGMAPLHQFFDLSLRRVINPRTGEPTSYVAANSLSDLVQPHNRFAHVRYPGRYFGRGDFGSGDLATSMPLLALGWNDSILNWQGVNDPRAEVAQATAPAWFPVGHPSPRTRNTAGTAVTTDDSLSGVFNGWLLPHFELGDPNLAGTSLSGHWERGYFPAGVTDPRWDRTGEDVIASNILSFDIRAFDATAPVFITAGPDGAPGQQGVNDDGQPASGPNSIDETVVLGSGLPSSELGAAGSDDVVVQVSDIAVFDLLGVNIFDPRRNATYGVHNFGLASQGSFVDLAYPYLGGTPLGIRTAQSLVTGEISTPSPSSTIAAVATVATNYNAFMQTQLSMAPVLRPTTTAGMNSMKRSGKLVHFDANGQICFFQPTYDTWTDAYESDGFDQTHTLNGRVSGALQLGTTWVLNDITGFSETPRLADGTAQAVLQVDTGRFIPTEPETSPPFAVDLKAISIAVRATDPASGEMAQFTIVESLD